MILYMDTSSLVKLYVDEVHSEAVHRWVQVVNVIATSRVAYPETLTALARRRREGDFNEASFQRAAAAFRVVYPFEFLPNVWCPSVTSGRFPPPAVGEGQGEGAASGETCSPRPLSPSPQPSPTKGEGAALSARKAKRKRYWKRGARTSNFELIHYSRTVCTSSMPNCSAALPPIMRAIRASGTSAWVSLSMASQALVVSCRG